MPGSGRASIGQRKSFQTPTTAKMETTPRMGREIGSTTERSVRIGLAPSMAAASRSSRGMESKKRFSRKMLKALVTEGSQITHGVLSRLRSKTGRSSTVRYCGTTRTVAGIIRVTSIAPRMALPRTGRSLESE